MPDLSHEASARYWHEYLDPMIYRVITFMERVENWTHDGDPVLERALRKLGQALDEVASIDINQLAEAEKFIQIAANIKTGRGLRLLQTLDVAQPGSASKILMHAEETSANGHDTASFFLKRNIIFERLRLLSRVFSEERLKLIARSLERDE